MEGGSQAQDHGQAIYAKIRTVSQVVLQLVVATRVPPLDFAFWAKSLRGLFSADARKLYKNIVFSRFQTSSPVRAVLNVALSNPDPQSSRNRAVLMVTFISNHNSCGTQSNALTNPQGNPRLLLVKKFLRIVITTG